MFQGRAIHVYIRVHVYILIYNIFSTFRAVVYYTRLTVHRWKYLISFIHNAFLSFIILRLSIYVERNCTLSLFFCGIGVSANTMSGLIFAANKCRTSKLRRVSIAARYIDVLQNCREKHENCTDNGPTTFPSATSSFSFSFRIYYCSLLSWKVRVTLSRCDNFFWHTADGTSRCAASFLVLFIRVWRAISRIFSTFTTHFFN